MFGIVFKELNLSNFNIGNVINKKLYFIFNIENAINAGRKFSGCYFQNS